MGRVLYSTEPDWEREDEGPARRSLPPAQQTIYVSRDRKGRRGKTVTVLRGFAHDDATLQKLLKRFKGLCGAGGTLKGHDTLEIQGDHRDRLADALRADGYRVKLSGG